MAATIAEILMAQGQHAAESRRARGQAWQPFLQYAANLPRQIMADRQAEQDRSIALADAQQARDLRGLQMERTGQELEAGRRELDAGALEADQRKRFAELVSDASLYSEDGLFDKPKALALARSKGWTDLAPTLDEYDREHDKSVWDQRNVQGQIAERERPKTREIKTRNADGSETVRVIEDAPGFEATSTPADTRSLQLQANDALKRGDANEYRRIMRVIQDEAKASRDPNAGLRDPLETNTTWAVDPRDGVTKPMTLAEARRIGATQAPTAEMRNKEAGKRTAARAVTAVKDLGSRIITKVGPAQRADAITRGAEAVFGNDPEFRTYQDSRMALAGTLAVEQQGSRVSDADVKALWLPMVPDAYRDTAESYKLKWDLIDAMRGVQLTSGGGDDAYAEYLKRQGAAGAR